MTHTSKRYATVDGVRMAYAEAGAGDPIVFVHGNPTSSYLWREVIAEVA
jgi:haloalkane dehalogenase